MKKINLLWIIGILIIITSNNVLSIYQQSYTSASSLACFDDSTTYAGAWTTFTANSSYSLSNISIEIKKVNSPTTQNVFIELYNTSGGVPSSALANSSTIMSISSLTTTLTYYNFSFTSPISITNGVQYGILIRTSATGGGSNIICLNTDTTAGQKYGYWNSATSSFGAGANGHTNWNIYSLTSSSSSIFNFSITATNTWNSSSILIFNATDGITNWNTTSGLIITNHLSNDTDLVNLTITSTGMDNSYYYNVNTSANLSATMNYTDTTPPSIYCSLNELTNISGYTTDLNITITEPYLTNTTISPEGLGNEINNSKRTNHYYGSTTYNITNLSSIGNYYINISAKDYNGNQANYTCNYTIIPSQTNFKIYVWDYLNLSLISIINIYENYTGETQTSNPFSKATTNYLSKTIPYNLIYATIQDTSYYHIPQNSTFNITRFISEFNTSMTPNKLVLSFIDSSGNAINTTGFITDTYPSTRGFTNSSIIIIQQNLSQGKVKVIFNSYSNWTQYYEYNNDYITYVNETLAIIPLTNLWSGYIQVVDLSEAPIEDAVIRMEYSIGTNSTIVYGKLMGQRLTESDGYTFFIGDKSSQVLLTIYKDGYSPVEKLVSFGDESFTRGSPLKIYLRQDNTIVKQSAWAQIPYEFTNRTKAIPISITAKDYTTIKIQTEYRNLTGLSIREVTDPLAIFGKTRFYLYPGQDFNNTGISDIQLSIYLDNTLWTNYTIKYYSTTTTDIFPTKNISAMQSKVGAVIEFIGLLIMILIMTLLFKEGRAGLHTFMGGTIILAIINPTYYFWVGFIGIAYYGYKIIYYVISE